MTVEDLLRRGHECQAAGDLAGAEGAFREADELGDAEGAILLGLMLKQRGDLPGAAGAFQRAEARGHPEAASSLGSLLWDSGDAGGAKAAYERSAAAGSTDAVLNLGLLLAQEGAADEALPYLRSAEEKGLPEASWAVGKILEDRNDLKGAEAAYRRAAEAGDANADYGLAVVLAKLGDAEGARAAFQTAHDRGHDGAGQVLQILDQQADVVADATTDQVSGGTFAGSRWRDLRKRARQARQHINPLALQYAIEAAQAALTEAQVAKEDRAGNIRIRKLGIAKAALRPSKTLRRALDGAAVTERLKAYNQQVHGAAGGSPTADAASSARAAGTGASGAVAGQPGIPPLGSGQRLATSQDVMQCVRLLEGLLLTYRTPKYQHLPPYVYPGWTWNGSSAAPMTVVACDDRAGDFMLIAFWPAGTGSEAGVFPLGSGDDRLKSLPLVEDWAARDATLRPTGTFGAGLIRLAPPQVTRAFTEDLLATAGFPHTPHNLARATRQLAIMLLIKAQEFISIQDPRAAQRFCQDHAAEKFFAARPGSPPEDCLNWILADLAAWNYGLLPYIQELPVRLRAIMLNSVGKAPFWDELKQ
jgi:hypothetical protein